MNDKLKENRHWINKFIDGVELEYNWLSSPNDEWRGIKTFVEIASVLKNDVEIREKKQELKTLEDCQQYMCGIGFPNSDTITIELPFAEKIKLFIEFQTIADALHKREYGEIKRYEKRKCDHCWHFYNSYNSIVVTDVYYPLTVYFTTEELAEEARKIFGEDKFLKYMKP